MPKITITSLKKEIFCNEDSQTVLSAFQENLIDFMHTCGAKGRCTTCAMIILSGNEYLNEPTKNELFYKSISMLDANERLACQCTVKSGKVVIKIPAAGRLPHLQYFD